MLLKSLLVLLTTLSFAQPPTHAKKKKPKLTPEQQAFVIQAQKQFDKSRLAPPPSPNMQMKMQSSVNPPDTAKKR